MSSCMEEARNEFIVLAGKPLGKWSHVRPKWRWEHTIKMDFRKAGCEDGRWMKQTRSCSEVSFDISGPEPLDSGG